MKMKKLVSVVVLLTLLAGLLCACSAGDYNGTPRMAGGHPETGDSGLGLGLIDNSYYARAQEQSVKISEDPFYDGEGDAQETESPDKPRKLVKNAEVNMQAQDVKEAYGNILAFAKEYGGYEFSQNSSTWEDYTTLQAKIKIPAEHLDTLLAFVAKCGEVTNSTVDANDITDQYYDAEIRLKTKKESLENYFKLLETARSIDEILQLQKLIDQQTEEIEALEGRLALWSSQVAESTVQLYIRQKDDPSRIEPNIEWDALTFADTGTLMLNGVVKAFNVLVLVLQYLLIAVAYLLPFLILPAAIVVIVVLRKKRKKSKTPKAPQDPRSPV